MTSSFHEVRVPLNIALLSVQNLESEAVYAKCSTAQRDIAQGLSNSLTSMETVLNGRHYQDTFLSRDLNSSMMPRTDVLSFDRMTEGKFSLATRPFSLNKSLELVINAHRPLSVARGLELTQSLDPSIDEVMFVGDDLRICQVVQNLVSNANKFTSSGSVHVATHLIIPQSTLGDALSAKLVQTVSLINEKPLALPAVRGEKDPLQVPLHELRRLPTPRQDTDYTLRSDDASSEKMPNKSSSKRSSMVLGTPKATETPRLSGEKPPSSTKVIVRVEVRDTGCGLKARDVAHNRLFSPYVQSELGRRQGGKVSPKSSSITKTSLRLVSRARDLVLRCACKS